MKKIIALASAVACLSGGVISSASANYYSWGDERLGINVTFPDMWSVAINKKSDDILRIVAPDADDHVVCEFKQREDNRYRVYPQRYDEAVSKISYGQKFWDDYTAKHDNVKYHFVQDQAGYGGYGSYTLASYTTGYPETYEERASIMFVGFYNGIVNIAECSAPILSYEKWRKQFFSIIGSAEFRKDYDELIVGHYEDFLSRRNKKFIFDDRGNGETRKY